MIALDEIISLDEHPDGTEILNNIEHHDYHVEDNHAEIHWVSDAHQDHSCKDLAYAYPWHRHCEGNGDSEMS